MISGKAVLTEKGRRWLDTGHAWIFRDDIRHVAAGENGAIVSVRGPNDEPLGAAFYSEFSHITLRLLTRNDEPVDLDFFRRRLRQAVAYRGTVIARRPARRLINAEGDGLPGLIVDCYDKTLVAQFLIPGTDRLTGEFTELLKEEFRPERIIARNDAAGRQREKLPRERRVLFGPEPVPVLLLGEGPSIIADVIGGHKTGLYLDQMANYRVARGYARGRVLDAFAYQGHFALHTADLADEVVTVESSATAVAHQRQNFLLNRIKNVTPRKQNAFDYLNRAEKRGERFDLVILDPPPFAPSSKSVQAAKRGYREINTRGLGLLNPGGVLITFCCSFNFSREQFRATVRQAAGSRPGHYLLAEELRQGPDHPALITTPETDYLQGLVVHRLH